MRIFKKFLICLLTFIFTSRALGLIDNSPVCGVLYDLTKTFANILEFSREYDNSGKVWSLLQAGPCPPTYACKVYEPLCAVSEGSNYQSFLNDCLMDEERRLTGRDWIKAYPGFCPEFLNYNPSTLPQRDLVQKVDPVMDTSSNLLSTASAKAVLKYISAISKHAQIISKEGISKKEEFNTSPDAASTSLPPNDMQLSSANNADQPPSNANLKYSNPLSRSTNPVTESPNSVSELPNPSSEYRISTTVSLNSQNSSSKLLNPHFEYSNPISESLNALSKLSNPASEFVMSIPAPLNPVSVISNPTSKSSNAHLESPYKVSQSGNPTPKSSSNETQPINDVTTNSPKNVSTTTNYVPQSNIVSDGKSYRLTQKNLSIVPQMSLPPEFLKQISQFYKTRWPRRRLTKSTKRSSSKSKNQKRQIPHSGPHAAKAEALGFTAPHPANPSYSETNPFMDYGNTGPHQTVSTLFNQQPQPNLASLGYIAPLQSESNPIASLRGDATSWIPERFGVPPYDANFIPCSRKSYGYPTYGHENSQEYSPAFDPNYNNPQPEHYSNYPHEDSYTISYYDPNTVSYPEYEHMLENTLQAELMDFLENYQEI